MNNPDSYYFVLVENLSFIVKIIRVLMCIVINFNDLFLDRSCLLVPSNAVNSDISSFGAPELRAPALKREKTQSFFVVFLVHVNTLFPSLSIINLLV